MFNLFKKKRRRIKYEYVCMVFRYNDAESIGYYVNTQGWELASSGVDGNNSVLVCLLRREK